MPLSLTGKKAHEKTREALADPQPGMRFHEMLSFWLYVVARQGDQVATLEANPPCTFPTDGKLRWQSVQQLHDRLEYDSLPGKYWVRFEDDGNDVDGWLDAVSHKSTETTDEP